MISEKEYSALESINRSLREKIAELTHQLKSKEQEIENLGALSLTEIILENSNAILFRRLAADDPKKRKMVYVSPNISCFGYHAEDFLAGKIMFRDIVYPEDSARTLKEIQDFVEQGIENYSQTYRIITSDGDVRWIEDRTSIFEDPATGTRYHQGIVIDIHEKKKALQLAAEVQKSLLPADAPVIEGLDIAGKTFPCDEVGGDYFDYLVESTTGDGSLSVVIGDISGHGVDAALLMASARAFLRMRASQQGTVRDIVMAMNRHLTGDMEKNGRFMTLFYLHLDRCNTSLEWVRAGHDPAVLYDPVTDLFTELKGPGLALGIDQDYDFQQQRFEGLAPHQVLVLTTDGTCEACNQNNEMFGKERLQNLVRKNSMKTAKDILDLIIQEHNSFTSGVAQQDDITIVIMKIV